MAARRKEYIAGSMKQHRKALTALDVLVEHKPEYTPDRFVWALEDYRRWLNDGLEEWEAEHIVKKLKGVK
jgi:cytochrome c-type biogenesis protein CcmE